LNAKEYNWEEFTQKDLFKAQLEAQFPNFGYIASTKRARFIQFCVDAGFLKYIGEQKIGQGYKILSNFSYSSMAAYRPTTLICKAGDIVILDSASRPKTGLTSKFIKGHEHRR